MRVINDADMQGLAVVKGHGVEVVMTLGTGLGTGDFQRGAARAATWKSRTILFARGKLTRNWWGLAALEKVGKAKWNRRVRRGHRGRSRILTNFDRLYIGGGNAKELTITLAPDIEVVDNANGIPRRRVALAAERQTRLRRRFAGR